MSCSTRHRMKSLGLIDALGVSGSVIVQGLFTSTNLPSPRPSLGRELRIIELGEAEGGVIGSCAT